MKKNVKIPDDLHKQLKLKAVRAGLMIETVVAKLLTEGLKR